MSGQGDSRRRRIRWWRPLLIVVLGVVLIWAVIVGLGLRVVRVAPPGRPLSSVEVRPRAETAGRPLPIMAESPRNLILFVVDGLGLSHLSAARMALHGIDAPTVWDRFTTTGWQRTHPSTGILTDSAAGATALATGLPTAYGAIAVDAEGQPLETLFERVDAGGYRTGIVTDSYIWDATVTAFIAHSPRRGNDVAESLMEQIAASSLDVLVGELEDVGEGPVPDWQTSVEILRRRFEVVGPEVADAELQTLATAEMPVAMIFEEDQVADLDSRPSLPVLTSAVLDRLLSTGEPYVLLVESEEPDSASHTADFKRLLRGIEAIEATLELLLDHVERDRETLMVFTSDHETGGLALTATGNNKRLRWIWATSDHTGVAVPLMAIGPGSTAFAGEHANWEVGQLLAQAVAKTR